jgi:glutamine amidotransferase
MCRLLGIVASEQTHFRFSLREAPRSLAFLSREHPHGWGVAVYETARGWTVQKHPECAAEHALFHSVAADSRGELLIAHVRLRTVGRESTANTHPFLRERWVFAHNGTITDVAWLREQLSPARRAQLVGETDSELFFAFLLTRFDRAGLSDAPASAATDALLRETMHEVLARPDFGAINFLLSNGDTLYAHRWGRTLYLLERSPRDDVMEVRTSRETGATIETPWSPRRQAVLLASEHITDEPWQAVEERALLRIDRLPTPRWQRLA